MMQFQDLPDHVLVKCEGRLTLQSIAEHKKLLEQVLSLKKPVHFDLANLIDIDTAALQLLMSFTSALKQQNLQCKLLNQSNAFKEMLKLLGMNEVICQ